MSNSYSKKLLICGDSFCVPDDNFPGLHFSEKISAAGSNLQVLNHAMGGASNALIASQLLQGLKFDPDFVVFSFTACDRYEYNNPVVAKLQDTTSTGISEYQRNRYVTNRYEWLPDVKEKNKLLNAWRLKAASNNFENLKNYMYISLCFTACQARGVPFCFSLGGFEHNYPVLVDENHVVDFVSQHRPQQLTTNLWAHKHTNSPKFHVGDDAVQTKFATECIEFLEMSREKNC